MLTKVCASAPDWSDTAVTLIEDFEEQCFCFCLSHIFMPVLGMNSTVQSPLVRTVRAVGKCGPVERF